MSNSINNSPNNITIVDCGSSSSDTSYTITLDDVLTVNNSQTMWGQTVILNGGTGSNWTNSSGVLSDTITITGGDYSSFFNKPFEDSFPEWNDFQKMCDEYPGLKIAYDHVKVLYKLTIDDWEAKKRGNND